MICEVSSRFHLVVCTAALFSGETSTLACLAAEVIYCSASLANCSRCFTVGGVRAVSISLMSCSPPHVKSVKWNSACTLGRFRGISSECLQGDVRGAITREAQSPCDRRSAWEDDLWSHCLILLAAYVPFLRAEIGELNWCCTRGTGSLSVFHGTCQTSLPLSRTWPSWSAAKGRARYSVFFVTLRVWLLSETILMLIVPSYPG